MRRNLCLALLCFAAPLPAFAQDGVDRVSELIVTASPFSEAARAGSEPYQVENLGEADLERTGATSILRGLSERAGQIQLNHAQANPYQPNVSYRGFDASPLVGNAQGLAVYVDGVRHNQAFGDTVNWDLIPDVAVRSMIVEGANPVFGLNALGGSIDVRLKDGRSFEGFEATVAAGSFGRYQGSVEAGGSIAQNVTAYVALSGLEEDGWRDFSPSSLFQGYADLTFDGVDHTTRFKLVGADNDMTGNGTSPVELLAVNREAVFTHPDRTQNEYLRASVSHDWRWSDALTLTGTAYFLSFNQATMNGDAADIEECDDPFDGFLCAEDEEDEPLEDANGDPIPDFLGGEDYAFLNRGRTNTDAYGAAIQMSHQVEMFGRPNRYVAGVTFDGGTSTFRASSELGELTEDRGYEGPGVIVESDEIGSIGVTAHNRYFGAFFSNALDLSPDLTLTISGRYNHADVTLRDLIGTELNGEHSFSRLNPAIGLSWRPAAGTTIFGGYSEANRAPTPAELSCADPAAPCSLTNFFVGDPPLKQVIARTFEAGVRREQDNWRWSLSAFSTDTEDDIMFIASPIIGRAYFQNVGETRRQGLTAEAGADFGRLHLAGSVSLIDATFETPLTLSSPESPFADVNGEIQVQPGDSLPGVSKTKAKLVADYDVTPRWRLSASALYQSGQYLYGDESNQDARTDSFTIVNVATTFDLTGNVSIFGAVENLFDTDYETFGTYSPVDEVPLVEVPNADDSRALSPGSPQAVYVGVKVRF